MDIDTATPDLADVLIDLIELIQDMLISEENVHMKLDKLSKSDNSIEFVLLFTFIEPGSYSLMKDKLATTQRNLVDE
ncbi:hypothetical protein ACTXT7_017164 [Hymenolepis weldensis]